MPTEIITESPISQAQNSKSAPITSKLQLTQSAKNILAKIYFGKFYANKRVFWVVTISLGLILVVIILGLIFGKRKVGNGSNLKSTPLQNQNNIEPTATPDQLSQIQINLVKIKDEIISLDVNQAFLQPPAIDYKISF